MQRDKKNASIVVDLHDNVSRVIPDETIPQMLEARIRMSADADPGPGSWSSWFLSRWRLSPGSRGVRTASGARSAEISFRLSRKQAWNQFYIRWCRCCSHTRTHGDAGMQFPNTSWDSSKSLSQRSEDQFWWQSGTKCHKNILLADRSHLAHRLGLW